MLEILQQILITLTTISALLTSLIAPVQPPEDLVFGQAIFISSEVDLMSYIKFKQTDYAILNKKYKQFPKTQFGTNPLYNYWVHEYQAPTGNGYQTFITKQENGVIYEKSIGTGPESVSRTYDWKIINENIASTTPL